MQGHEVTADSITVVTLTRHRPHLLVRAMQSVERQDYPGEIDHLIMIDDDPAAAAVLERYPPKGVRRVRYFLERRPQAEVEHGPDDRHSVYPRLARLLNRGIARAISPWVAFLDDDNEYEPDHLRSLMASARTSGSPAVHSARRIFWADGSPYLEPFFPGAASPEEGARIYELMCRKGVWLRGTNILQDRIDPEQTSYRNSTVLGPNDPVFLVDQNLWLIRRNVLLEFPIPEDFSERDFLENTCPDDKMLEILVKNRVPITSSKHPSVRYYLGGISNGDEQPASSAGVGSAGKVVHHALR
jgi:glycosyltransferase involved in cell wall biosynthesis